MEKAITDDVNAFHQNVDKIAEKRKRKPDFYLYYGDGIPVMKPQEDV